MAKRRPVRAPFVTIATAALAVGCGAKFEVADSADSGSETGADASSDVVTTDAIAEGCPTGSMPTAGEACAPEGQSCDYSKCSAPEWRGGPFFQCSKGVWIAGGSSCNPPPPELPCPSTEPRVGTACDRFEGSPACKYPDTCPSNPTDYGSNDYVCKSGTWALTSPAYVAPCPSEWPMEGTTCACAAHMSELRCRYSTCMSFSLDDAICDPGTKKWRREITPCEPSIDAGASPG
jgi:hypothetical protein